MPDFYRSGIAILRVAFGGTVAAAMTKMNAAKKDVEKLEATADDPVLILLARQKLLETQQIWHTRLNRFKAFLMGVANILANFPKGSGRPAVTPELMRAGGVRIAFSPLIDPCDEFFDGFPKWPAGTPFFHLQQQMEFVEYKVKERAPTDNMWFPTRAKLQDAVKEARTGERIALIHCVEGGYYLGDNREDITIKVEKLARCGVGYVTLAHLFFRRLATCVNALPIPDWIYNWRFPQENVGLTELGKFAVRQLAAQRILVDVCHMSELAIVDTLRVLDEYDTENQLEAPTPIIATHMACRIGKAKYNLSADTIKSIIKRKGLLGVIFSRHLMREHLNTSEATWEDTCQVVKSHLDKIREYGDCDLTCAAIGSDLDGFIKPTLKGLEDAGKIRDLSRWILTNYTNEANGILRENAIRVMTRMWM
jgi:microsomal dipeptidase-like Zn-dependent dipeptidase